VKRLVILDNEAVQALMSVGHRKHRRALAHVQVVGTRKRKAVPIDLMVPTGVRAEAGWDRTAPDAALINLLRIRDAALDSAAANVAAAIVSAHAVSVADAHIGALVRSRGATEAVTVLTSDPADIETVVGSRPVTVVRI
jgi:hypothetical protein